MNAVIEQLGGAEFLERTTVAILSMDNNVLDLALSKSNRCGADMVRIEIDVFDNYTLLLYQLDEFDKSIKRQFYSVALTDIKTAFYKATGIRCGGQS